MNFRATGGAILLLNPGPGRVNRVVLVPADAAERVAKQVQQRVMTARAREVTGRIADEKLRRHNWNRRLFVRLCMGWMDASEADDDIVADLMAMPGAAESGYAYETNLHAGPEMDAAVRILAACALTSQSKVAVSIDDWMLMTDFVSS